MRASRPPSYYTGALTTRQGIDGLKLSRLEAGNTSISQGELRQAASLVQAGKVPVGNGNLQVRTE